MATKRRLACEDDAEPADRFDRGLKMRVRRAVLASVVRLAEEERQAQHGGTTATVSSAALAGGAARGVAPAKRSFQCLFCANCFPSKHDVVSHLRELHSFRLGHPDNMVAVGELLRVLRDKLAACQCLCCEKEYSSGSKLRQHMNKHKKRHMKLNKRNRVYDRFFLINYLDEGADQATTWIDIRKGANKPEVLAEDQDHDDDDDDDDSGDTATSASAASSVGGNRVFGGDDDDDGSFGDWQEELEDEPTKCLFCDQRLASVAKCLEHAVQVHQFDLASVRRHYHLKFMDTVRLINWIRRRVAANRCPVCDDDEAVQTAGLAAHFASQPLHCSAVGLDEPSVQWRHDEQYLIPVLDNDPLLSGFEMVTAVPSGGPKGTAGSLDSHGSDIASDSEFSDDDEDDIDDARLKQLRSELEQERQQAQQKFKKLGLI